MSVSCSLPFPFPLVGVIFAGAVLARVILVGVTLAGFILVGVALVGIILAPFFRGVGFARILALSSSDSSILACFRGCLGRLSKL